MKGLLKSLTVVCAAFCIVGCSSKDLYDEKAVEMKVDATYTDYFQKKYPNVDLNQDWDYATGQITYSLPSSSSGTRALTRGDDYELTTGEFILEGTVNDYMRENMKAGMDNKEKGNPFYMKVPENPFTIVPIFQGNASYVWELWMYVDGIGDIKVWSKGEDLAYQTTEGGQWTQIKAGKQDPIPNKVSAIKSKSYTFSGLPAGKNMYFYLKVTSKNNMICSSLDQMMLTLDGFPTPKNLPKDNTAMIVGCEDQPGGDYDYEDMVFMVYGNPTPPVHVVKERIKMEGKRYMMEDLGGMDDFDFNDIVVDVYNRTKEILWYDVDENGEEKLDESKTTTEKMTPLAIVRAMGGTLDFTLTIGNKTWTKSDKFNFKDMLNTRNIDWNKNLDEFEAEGWIYKDNNVSVTVVSDGKKRDIKFSKGGTAPMIIAVDPTTHWMEERKEVPADWFNKGWWVKSYE